MASGRTLRTTAPAALPGTELLPRACAAAVTVRPGCTRCDSRIFDACGAAPPSGFNVTLHVPIVPDDLPLSVDKLLVALRAMAGTFRFEHALWAVDATNKTPTGAEDACCQASAALEAAPRLTEHLLRVSHCASVRQLRYGPPAIPRLHRLFGRIDDATVRLLASAGKTHLQYYALLSNAWRLATRFVLHLDVDAVLLWAVPSARTATIPVLEALMRYARQRQDEEPSSFGVSVEACRTAWACLPRCPALGYPQNWSHAGAKILHPEAFVLDLTRWGAEPVAPFRWRVMGTSPRPTLHVEGLRASTSIIDRLLDRWAERTGLAPRLARLPRAHATGLGAICHSTFFHLDRMANYTWNKVAGAAAAASSRPSGAREAAAREPALSSDRPLARCCDEACPAPAGLARCEHKLERLQGIFNEALPAVRRAASMCSRA